MFTALVTTAAVLSAAAAPAQPPGSFVYSKELKSGFELYVSRADGSHQRRLTRIAGGALHPDWSPDGRRVVFEFERPDEQGCTVAIVDRDGSDLVRLGEQSPTTCDNQPSFMPDGKRIVFVHYDDTTGLEKLATMALDGTDLRVLETPWKAGVSDPNMSPNGRRVSFVRLVSDETRQALYSMRLDGSELRKLTPLRWAVAVKHEWSPDGRLIALSRLQPVPDVVTIRPNGRVVDRVTRSEPDTGAFVGGFSPNGRRLVMRLERRDGEQGRLAVSNLDGSDLSPLTPFSTLRPRFIDWGPR